MTSEHFDMLIVGAGISGIGAAYHLGANCPGKTYAILERREGMGGTWDATNVVDARVAVVTPVALDHAEYLGPDVATIAGEKAGIIKADSVAVLATQQPGALDALVRRAVEVDAVVAREGTEFGVLDRRVALGGQQLRLQGLGGEYPDVYLPLFGAQRFVTMGYAMTANPALPQDAIEPLRRMVKWIVDESCPAETCQPLWLVPPEAA